MKDQEVSDAELYELLARAVTALETLATYFCGTLEDRKIVEVDTCPHCGSEDLTNVTEEPPTPVFGPDDPEDETTILGDDGEPPAALTRSEEEILRDPRPGKGVIVTEGYAPPPVEDLRTICPNCHETVVRIYADPENNMLRCPECSFVWELQDAV